MLPRLPRVFLSPRNEGQTLLLLSHAVFSLYIHDMLSNIPTLYNGLMLCLFVSNCEFWLLRMPTNEGLAAIRRSLS